MPKVYNRHHRAVPDTAVYVGRGTPFGNPFVVGEHGTRDQVLSKYLELVQGSPALRARIRRRLKGKDLVCSCAPARCHADVLLAIANDWPLPSWLAQEQLELSIP